MNSCSRGVGPFRCVAKLLQALRRSSITRGRYRSLLLKVMTPYTPAEKIESFEWMNSTRETNGTFDSCNSCSRLVASRLHKLHESKFPFFHVLNLSVRNFRIFLLMYTGLMTAPLAGETAHSSSPYRQTEISMKRPRNPRALQGYRRAALRKYHEFQCRSDNLYFLSWLVRT